MVSSTLVYATATTQRFAIDEFRPIRHPPRSAEKGPRERVEVPGRAQPTAIPNPGRRKEGWLIGF
jgi:hypothetical protein